MTPEHFANRYFLATGIMIDMDTATKLLKHADSPWHKKILQMADDVEAGPVWDRLCGEYNGEIINPKGEK